MTKEKKEKTLEQIKNKVKEADSDKQEVINTAEAMGKKSDIKVWIPVIIGIIVLMLGVLEKLALVMIVGGVVLAIGVYKLMTEDKGK